MSETRNAQAYGESSYWDERYTKDPTPFDWYQKYSGLEELLNMYFDKSWDILMVGCGNAAISADMAAAGYRSIKNIDISKVVIDAMTEKYADVPQLSYIQMDVMDMSAFPNESFGGILDKGMVDALMCGEGAAANVDKTLSECARVLRRGGVYMMITYGDPRVRYPYLDVPKYDWRVIMHVIERPGAEREARGKPVSLEPISLSLDGNLAPGVHWDDNDLHYIYVCIKN